MGHQMRMIPFLTMLMVQVLACRGDPKPPRPFPASTAAPAGTSGNFANAIGDLVRFEFSGSVETQLIGPKHDETTDTMNEPIQLPLAELDTSRLQYFNTRSVPSLYIGVDYDFSQRQRKWHGISCLLSRLRFQPTPTIAVDVSREQAMDIDVPSATSIACSWKGYRSSLRKSSQSSSLLVSIPVLPIRLRWDCALSSDSELTRRRTQRSRWQVDVMGQIRGSQRFQISQDIDARFSLRRNIRWISSDEGMIESTHVGLSLQLRHGNQYSTETSFTAQLEQIQSSAQLRVRHDVALGRILN